MALHKLRFEITIDNVCSSSITFREYSKVVRTFSLPWTPYLMNQNNTDSHGLFGEVSRRDFLYGAGAFALLPIARIEPELILYNGNFWTVNDNLPRAQAVTISGGRFFAVGTNDEILALAAGFSKKVDLGGKAVFPGFIDAH